MKLHFEKNDPVIKGLNMALHPSSLQCCVHVTYFKPNNVGQSEDIKEMETDPLGNYLILEAIPRTMNPCYYGMGPFVWTNL